MTIEDIGTIDFTGIERDTRTLVLTLTDAWGWSPDEETEHLRLLQDKLNVYLAAIESREVFETFAKRTKVALHPAIRTKISVRAKHPLSDKGKAFFTHVRHVVEEAGIEFEHVVGFPER